MEVGDAAGNITVDSQDVKFVNGINAIKDQEPGQTKNSGHYVSMTGKSQAAFYFQLTKSSFVTLKIMAVSGREIKTLFAGMCAPGARSVVWDGTDNNGSRVHAGIYLYSLQADNVAVVRKMVYSK